MGVGGGRTGGSLAFMLSTVMVGLTSTLYLVMAGRRREYIQISMTRVQEVRARTGRRRGWEGVRREDILVLIGLVS